MPVYQQGMNQQTPAIQSLLGSIRTKSTSRKRSNGSRSKKRSMTASSRRATPRRKSSASGKAARLVKGSAAAKRYMAKIRKMRKK